jgi:hypothetical protein
MRIQSDYPPPFMNPNVLIYGALADAYATQCGRPPTYQDPGFSPELSAKYEAMFQEAFLTLIEEDEARGQSTFTWDDVVYTYGANYDQSHDDTPYIAP